MKDRLNCLLSEVGESFDYLRSDVRNLSRSMAELEELIESYRTFATTLTLSTSVERATRRKLLKKTLRVVGPATDARQEENSSWRGRVEGRQS
jgi:prefoldin subunit 5